MADHEPWWAEWWSAVIALAWCLYNATGVSGLEALAPYQAVTEIVPSGYVYLFASIVPVMQALALRLDRRPARLALCAIMAWWWGFITLAIIFLAPVSTPAVPMYAGMACINLNSLWRLGWVSRRPARGDG